MRRRPPRYWAAVKRAEATIAPFLERAASDAPGSTSAIIAAADQSVWLKMHISPPSRPQAMPCPSRCGGPSNTEHRSPRGEGRANDGRTT